MYRHDAHFTALPPPHANGWPVGVQREIPHLDRQRLGGPESGPPLDQEQQPRSRIRSVPDERLYLVRLQVLRELLYGFPSRSRCGFGCWPLGQRLRWARAVLCWVVIKSLRSDVQR